MDDQHEATVAPTPWELPHQPDATGSLPPWVIEFTGRIHAPPPANEQPVSVLVRWRVIEIGGSRHLCGWCLDDDEGRVSSQIVDWNPAVCHAITRSGRRYVLQGPPGRDPDAEYVLATWLALNGWTAELVQDVTPVSHSALGRQD